MSNLQKCRSRSLPETPAHLVHDILELSALVVFNYGLGVSGASRFRSLSANDMVRRGLLPLAARSGHSRDQECISCDVSGSWMLPAGLQEKHTTGSRGIANDPNLEVLASSSAHLA
jgi:hypothetical protein